MNLKEDKDKIVEMLTSKDLELRKLAIDYIRNNYDFDSIVPEHDVSIMTQNLRATQKKDGESNSYMARAPRVYN